MAFDLAFTDTIDCRLVAINREASGIITIGDFSETFFTALNILSKRDYLQQWLEAVRYLQGGRRASAIITSFEGHGGEILGWWWPIYDCGNGDYAVQNQLIHRDMVNTQFSVATCYDYVGPHYTRNADGEHISEWATNLTELAAFASRVEERLSECG